MNFTYCILAQPIMKTDTCIYFVKLIQYISKSLID